MMVLCSKYAVLDPPLIYDPLTLIDINHYNWFDRANWAGTVKPAGEVAGKLYSAWQAVAYSFSG